MSYQLPTVLGMVNDLGITEVISESTDPGGIISSKDIENRSVVPAGKVSRFLRYLAGRGIFEEVAPDVWTHTEASKLLDSGMSYEEIVRDPVHRFAKGAPYPAFILHAVEQGGMAAVSMVTAFREDKYKTRYNISETPFKKIYNIDAPFWQWLEQGGRVLNQTKFKGFETNNARSFAFSYYPWSDLPPNSIIVDVGGGVSSAMALVLPLAPEDAKAIVQELSYHVLERGETFWADRDATAMPEGGSSCNSTTFSNHSQ